VHSGGAGQELAGVGVLGGGKDLRGRRLFYKVAVLHDGDAVCDLADDREVMRDEEHGQVVGAAEGFEEGEDLGLDGDVKRGGGFICDEELRAVDEGHGNEDALALAAGELVGVIAEAGGGGWEGYFFKSLSDAGADLCAGGAGVVGQQCLSELVADAHDRVEGGHGLLKDHGDLAAAELTHFSCGERKQGLAGEGDGAGERRRGGEQAEECERGGGFTGAGFTDETEGFAGGDGEGDIVYDNAVISGVQAEGDGEVFDLEQGCGHRWSVT